MIDVVKHHEEIEQLIQAAQGKSKAVLVQLGGLSEPLLTVPLLNKQWVGGDRFANSIIQFWLPRLKVHENLIWKRTQHFSKAYTKSVLGVTRLRRKGRGALLGAQDFK